MHGALDAGVTFFDTADSYGDGSALGTSELFVARALQSYWRNTDDVVVATKIGRRLQIRWRVDGRPDYLKRAAEDSLRRLGLEAHPLLQLHGPDPAVPFAESVGALKEMVEDGLALRVGLCNVNVAQLGLARSVLGNSLVSVQNRMTAGDRGDDAVFQFCERYDMAVLSRAPVGGRDRAPSLGEHASMLAGARRVSAQRLALPRLRGRLDSIILIAGLSEPEAIREVIEAARVRLDPTRFVSVASTILPIDRANQKRTAACANRSAAT